jgi:transposase
MYSGGKGTKPAGKGAGWATVRRPSSLARVRPVCVSGCRALSMRLGRANARAVATRVLRFHRGRYPLAARRTISNVATNRRWKTGAWLAFVAASNIEAGVNDNSPATQLTVKTLLNHVQRFAGFVYRSVALCGKDRGLRIEVQVEPHAGMHRRCGECREPCPGYDTLDEREWQFVPFWGIPVWFLYAPRRVQCPTHGVVVEHMPWSDGKRPMTKAMMLFLARWARRLSWRETARSFRTSWEAVYRSVEWCVEWGLAHRDLNGVSAIGIDEIHWGKAKGFLTVIYQIDTHCRRLLWVGPKRTQATLRRGLRELGPQLVGGLRFVCSDMWKPYLQIIARQAGHALHVIDRFHVVMNLNKALDAVRRQETSRLRGSARAEHLKHMRWKLLRRGSRVRGHARWQLRVLWAAKLATGRAWMLKESFQHLWKYKSPVWAEAFLRAWTAKAMRSRLEPIKKVAKTLRTHQPLVLNWFRARGELCGGAVEGLNNKIRVVTRRSYGFRTYRAMEVALYHNLGRLPEPEFTHEFC